MSDGFLYNLTGDKHAVQLVVSLLSLRHRHSEPVLIGYGDDAARQVCMRILDDERLRPVSCREVAMAAKARHKAKHHANKSCMEDWTIFGRTIFLDADTLVVGSLDDLWTDHVTLTQFAGWVTTGRTIGSRLRKFEHLLPDDVRHMTSVEHPAINTGVLAWGRSADSFHQEWRRVALANPVFMGDEIAANLIYERHGARVLDHRWNYSPLYSPAKRDDGTLEVADDVKVWHFHGAKHCNNPAAISVWAPWYDKAVRENVAGLAQWTPAGDKRLRRFLDERTS